MEKLYLTLSYMSTFLIERLCPPAPLEEAEMGRERDQHDEARAHEVRNHHRRAPVVAVGHEPGQEAEQERGQVGAHGGEPRECLRARELEHEPHERDHVDRVPGLREDLPGPQQGEIPPHPQVPQGFAPGRHRSGWQTMLNTL